MQFENEIYSDDDDDDDDDDDLLFVATGRWFLLWTTRPPTAGAGGHLSVHPREYCGGMYRQQRLQHQRDYEIIWC